jgi:hypothetical protein
MKLDVKGIATRPGELILPKLPPLLEPPVKGTATTAPAETLDAARRSIEKFKD